MGLPSIGAVIQMLCDAGIRTQRSFPGTCAPEPEGPVAAVSIRLYDTASKLMTVCVQVRGPASRGGSACEEMAMNVSNVLFAQGAGCRQGACSFDERTGQLVVEVLATWTIAAQVEDMVESLPYYVQLNGTKLPYAIGFTAQQTVETEFVGAMAEAEDKHVLRRDMGWKLTLEELFIPGAIGAETVTEPFTLQVVRYDGVENYTDCYFTSVQRKDTIDGIKQTRIAWTKHREVYDLG